MQFFRTRVIAWCGKPGRVIISLLLLLTTFITGGIMVTHAASAVTLPKPDHVVIVMEENHAPSQIVGSPDAPYINSLIAQGALFTDSHGVAHPSQPNYLALFSGSTQGITDDSCPHTFSGPNLGSELSGAGQSFAGYSESMPRVGFTDCREGGVPIIDDLYARKHAPWVNFTNVPSSANQPWTNFPTDYSTLPTVSFVIPNQNNDMHSELNPFSDDLVPQGDAWLQNHLDGYVQWAKTHNSLLIVQWDEDDNTSVNQIPTIFVGPMVKPGQYGENINHYNVLRTLEDMYGLSPLGNSASAASITDCWQ